MDVHKIIECHETDVNLEFLRGTQSFVAIELERGLLQLRAPVGPLATAWFPHQPRKVTSFNIRCFAANYFPKNVSTQIVNQAKKILDAILLRIKQKHMCINGIMVLLF